MVLELVNEPNIALFVYMHSISIILLFFLSHSSSSQKNAAPQNMDKNKLPKKIPMLQAWEIVKLYFMVNLF